MALVVHWVKDTQKSYQRLLRLLLVLLCLLVFSSRGKIINSLGLRNSLQIIMGYQ